MGSHKGTTTLLRKSSTIYERIVNSSFKIRFLDYIALSLEGVTVLEKPRVSREVVYCSEIDSDHTIISTFY